MTDDLFDTVDASQGDGDDGEMDDETMWDVLEVYEAIEEGEWDQQKRQELMEDIDFEQLQYNLANLLTEYIQPHVEDIRERTAQKKASGETRHRARAELESRSEPEQNEAFDDALGDLVEMAINLRTDPNKAGEMMKQAIRNPWFMERLLLIFSNPENIEPEYGDQMKEVATWSTRWVSMFLIPGAYTEQERREVLLQFYDEQEVERILARLRQQE